ncbi:GNAT family N-acetyltransferase [Albibacillus kandeliae]|uniref:GNAT family N-acetyltransferase n=1 Tax=Albibacillus kandeliae TaxID=2174228 RepID=UPI000D693D32|nr:GNAT family N-acetyltransferase [Albibacillus kandeliae]
MSSLAALALRPIGLDDYDLVKHVAVAPEQVLFSGTLESAFESPDPMMDLFAVLLDGHPVGFFKIDRGYDQTHPFAREGELGLRAVMVDAAHQGKGIGKGTIRLLQDYLPRHYPGAPSLALTVNLRNPIAVRSYLSAGFIDTGELWEGGAAGPQHIMRMELAETPPCALV